MENDIEGVHHQIIKVRSQQQLQHVLQNNESRLVQIVKKSLLVRSPNLTIRSQLPSPVANEKKGRPARQ